MVRRMMRAYANRARMFPYSASLQVSIGRIELETGNRKKAYSHFQRAVYLGPNDPLNYYYRGLAEFSMNKFDDAKRSFKKVIELFPNGAPAYFGLGQILENESNIQEAEIQYSKAVELDPTNEHYRIQLERVQRR